MPLSLSPSLSLSYFGINHEEGREREREAVREVLRSTDQTLGTLSRMFAEFGERVPRR